MKTSNSVSDKKVFVQCFLAATKNQTILHLEQLKEVAAIENYSPVVIAALSLQLLANEEDNRQVTNVAKEIVVNSGFSKLNE